MHSSAWPGPGALLYLNYSHLQFRSWEERTLCVIVVYCEWRTYSEQLYWVAGLFYILWNYSSIAVLVRFMGRTQSILPLSMRWMDVFSFFFHSLLPSHNLSWRTWFHLSHQKTEHCSLRTVCHCLSPRVPLATTNHFDVHVAGSFNVPSSSAPCYDFSLSGRNS